METPARIEPASIRNARVLSVSKSGLDGANLERILHEFGASGYTNSECTLIAHATLAAALSALEQLAIGIVICDCDHTPGTWRELLDHISLLPDPPLLIVSSRLADERLWAEALNLGAWDVLAKPFEHEEVIRIVGFAWQHWQDRHGVHISRTRQRMDPVGSRRMAATGT